MKFKMKTAYMATLLALGTTASAERMIVSYNDNGNGVKNGHSVLVNGNGWFAVELNENGKSAMRGRGGFKSMEVDAVRYQMGFADSAGNPNATQVYPYNYYQVQGDQLTLQSGQKVCVIDSGLARETGEVGGGNSDFDFSVITGDSDSGTGDWFRDGGAHGTHVAGTIGAADNGIGTIGVAPGVPMHIIKVFNDAGWGYSSDLAQAANLCAAAGANIINMSLGGGGANSTEENAFNSFVANGGLVLAAAGNDGNSVRSYPAGYKSVVMVGGVNKDDAKYAASQFPSHTVTSGRGKNRVTEDHDGYGVEISGGGENVLSTVPAGTGASASLTVDGTDVATAATSNTGTVTASAYFMGTGEATDSGANGKICIIDRGNIAFADKVNNCGNSGGVGAVVINNVAGEGAINMDIAGVTTNIPAVGASLDDRSAIVGASSATIVSGAGDYAQFSGTSMATPTVAGAAALLWSNNPNCTGEEIRAALKISAHDIGPAGRDVDFGYGIAKAKDANDYLATQACGGGTPPPPGNIAPVASFTYNCSDLACSFNGSSSSDSDGSVASYSWSFGGSNATANNTFAATGTYNVTLTVTDNEGATDSTSQSVSVDDGVTPPPANMTLSGNRSKGNKQANLSWTGGTTSNVDIYINGGLNNTTANDGSQSFSVNRNSSYTFTVCEAGSTTVCTNQINL
jgi:subtilisin family serine protease